jgi:MoaA/NifB/PqqE/SkfB family radical SAM enzyme
MAATTHALAPPLPREVQIEVTGACNLQCPMCLVSYRPRLARSEGAFDLDAFKALVDGLPDLERVTLQGLGEPLLAPDLQAMVEYAAARGVRMGFNTNAMLLTRARAEPLVRAGLAWLHVSLDGATAATYESIRAGASFARLRRNVTELVSLMRRLGAERPRLSLVYVAMRRNIHELPAAVRLAAEWGVGRLWVQGLSHSFSDTDPDGAYAEIRRFARREALDGDDPVVADALAAARAEAARSGVALRLPDPAAEPRARPRGTPGCDWPWRSAYVTRRGAVQPCCMVMGEDRATLGHLGQSDFSRIWSGEAYRDFRARLRGADPPSVCRGCGLYRGTH